MREAAIVSKSQLRNALIFGSLRRLRDLGLSQADIWREVGKPRWQH